MKKIVITLLIFAFIFSFVACKNDKAETPTDVPSDVLLPFENVPDTGKIEYEKTYTMKEILAIKTNWNKEYVFPVDVEDVIVKEKDERNIKMTLQTSNISFQECIDFYEKYTINKENCTSTKTQDTYFVTFVDSYVARTILVINNQKNISITVTYSLDEINKR